MQKTSTTPEADTPPQPPENPAESSQPKEIGGRKGLDPTRYGDWENKGKCVDF